MILYVFIIFCVLQASLSFRILNITSNSTFEDVFIAYETSFVGTYGDSTNIARERINEGNTYSPISFEFRMSKHNRFVGAFFSPDQELLFEGVAQSQSCPGMLGPFTDGGYYCTSKDHGKLFLEISIISEILLLMIHFTQVIVIDDLVPVFVTWAIREWIVLNASPHILILGLLATLKNCVLMTVVMRDHVTT